jgi:hypothetical protein
MFLLTFKLRTLVEGNWANNVLANTNDMFKLPLHEVDTIFYLFSIRQLVFCQGTFEKIYNNQK